MRAIQTGEFQNKLLIEASVTVDASEKSTKALKLWRMGLITHILMANEELSLSVPQVIIFTRTNGAAFISKFISIELVCLVKNFLDANTDKLFAKEERSGTSCTRKILSFHYGTINSRSFSSKVEYIYIYIYIYIYTGGSHPFFL